MFFDNYFGRKLRLSLAHRKKPEAKTTKYRGFVALCDFPIHAYFTGTLPLTKDSVLRACDYSYIRIHA